MISVKKLWFVIGIACFFLYGSEAQAVFRAYNDCIRGTGDTTADNVTNWTIYNGLTSNTSGYLINYDTGQVSSIKATFSWNSSAGLNVSERSGSEDGISQPRFGTPAYEVFGGIVDFSERLIYYGSSGWWVEITFEGLDPNRYYRFATTAIRARDYSDRISLFTISNVLSADNTSSNGIYEKNGYQTKLVAGGNHRDTTGYIVQWENIRVADRGDGTGTFRVRAEAFGDNYKAYPFGGFLLEDNSGNLPPQVHAGDDQRIVSPREYLRLDGTVTDDGYGQDEGGQLTTEWRQISGPVQVEFVGPVDEPDITARFREIGDYVLELRANDGEFETKDQVTVSVVPPVFPLGDLLGDGMVSTADLVLLVMDWLTQGSVEADLDGDGQVDLTEWRLLAQSWQEDWTGSLQVNLTPADSVGTQAQWRVDGGPWHLSGEVVSGLLRGEHQIEYDLVTGWAAPEEQTITITAGETALITGEYYQPPMAVVINEFMAVNSNLLDIRPALSPNIYTAVNGEPAYEDWIELKNLTDEPISLAGWYLTDSRGNLTKWAFPTGAVIPNRGYLVVYASNKDNEKYGYPFVDDNGYWHTNFDLSIGGEYLALVRPDGGLIEYEYPQYPPQRGLVSYGLAQDNLNQPGYLVAASPGSKNAGAYEGLVADTRFSLDRGFYEEPIQVEINCDTPGAQIRYTTDQTEPTASHGMVYSGPISINHTTCLRAAAFKDGYLQSNIDTQTYLYLDDVTKQGTDTLTGGTVTPAGYPYSWGTVTGDYQVDPDIVSPDGLFGSEYAATFKDDLKSIPSISLVLPKDKLFGSTGIYINKNQDGTERVGSVELLDPSKKEKFHTNCGIRMQGGASSVQGGTTLNRWKCYKLSFRLMFRGIYGGQLDYPLFGVEGADRYNTVVLDSRPQLSWVHSSVSQRLHGDYVRDQAASNVQLAMGGYACHGRPVHLYLNGLYWGLYWMHERPDGAFAASYLGGDKEDYDVVKHVYNNAIDGSYDDYVAMFNLSTGDGGDEVGAFAALNEKLDVPDFIDYMIANYYIGNTDWDHKNWYATHNHFDPQGRWRWHMWDGEHVMDDTGSGNVDVTGRNISMAPTGFHQKWIKNDEYRMLFADRVYKHFFHQGALTPENYLTLFTQLTDSIDRAIVGESARWGDNRRPTLPYTRNAEWLTECNRMRTEYLPARRDIVLAQFTSGSKNPLWYPLVTAPEFYIDGRAQYGGSISAGAQLAMVNVGDKIYFTLDGTDPRLPGGSVSPAAVQYQSELTLNKTVIVKARSRRSDGQWSPLAHAVFALESLAKHLRITELMYHPDEAGAEYVEIMNTSDSESVNLDLVQFTNGIDFTFGEQTLDPGEFVVVVQDLTAFRNRYNESIPVAGQYSGSLANQGERIELADAMGNIIVSMNYQDDWYGLTDGAGFSLTCVDPYSADLENWSQKSGWRSSLTRGGTPGEAALAALPAESIVINELLAHSHETEPDWIEFFNTTATDINVGGWFLTDDDDGDPNRTKYEMPADTLIPAGGYLVLVGSTSFNNSQAPGCHQPFGLSEGGETVYLFSGADGEVTGYYQTQQSFDASLSNVSLGRYEKAELSGGYDFVPQAHPTAGQANSGPLISQIVISELYYNPINGSDYEYIRLYNRSNQSVTLMTEVSTETSPGIWETEMIPWRLGGVDYILDPGIVIEPHDYILIARNPQNYVGSLGPYPGKLSNGGEEISVMVPGDQDYGRSRFWIPVDQVRYDDTEPWPASADGQGDALKRVNLDQYGRDFSNWVATTPSVTD